MKFDEELKINQLNQEKAKSKFLIAKKKWLEDHTILKPLNISRKTEILDNRLIGHLNEW